MPRAAHDRQRRSSSSCVLVSLSFCDDEDELTLSRAGYKPRTILDDLQERIRALIKRIDKSHEWQHVVPGADRPWKGQFNLPSLSASLSRVRLLP